MVKARSYGSIPPSSNKDTARSSNVPVLVTAFLSALATGGPTYAFGLYGSTLKSTLHLTQSQLDTISSSNFCAGLLSWIPGMCVDRWGPKAAMIVGGGLQSLFLSLYWVAATHPLPGEVPLLSLLGVLVFMCNSLVIGGLFKILVLHCTSKGTAVGIAKGYLGLGAGTLASLFNALSLPSDLDFLPMAAVVCIIAIVLPAACLLPSGPVRDVVTVKHYRVAYIGLLILGLLIVGTSCIFLFQPIPDELQQETRIELVSENPRYAKAMLIIVAWLGPVISLLFLPEELPTDTDEEAANSNVPSSISSTVDSVDLTLLQVLKTLRAWLLLWTCTILVGSGTIMTNNMGQMVEAHNLPSRASSACLALFSVAQAASRVICGALSDSVKAPRPTFLVVASLIGVTAHVVLGMATNRESFVSGVVLSGVAFGMVWPLMVLVIGEVFGTRHHGANYMFYDGFTSAVGTLLISKYLAQTVYESHIEGDDINCLGNGCFRWAHFVTAILCATAFLTSLGVTFTTMSVYQVEDHQRPDTNLLQGSPYFASRSKRPSRRKG